jgi:hypothetical protein
MTPAIRIGRRYIDPRLKRFVQEVTIDGKRRKLLDYNPVGLDRQLYHLGIKAR